MAQRLVLLPCGWLSACLSRAVLRPIALLPEEGGREVRSVVKGLSGILSMGTLLSIKTSRALRCHKCVDCVYAAQVVA